MPVVHLSLKNYKKLSLGSFGLHDCVEDNKLDTGKISFIPPDGTFLLMDYMYIISSSRVDVAKQHIPLILTPSLKETGKGMCTLLFHVARLEMKLSPRILRLSGFENINISVVLPFVSSISAKPEVGTVEFDEASKVRLFLTADIKVENWLLSRRK
jgi:hypothetical protein